MTNEHKWQAQQGILANLADWLTDHSDGRVQKAYVLLDYLLKQSAASDAALQAGAVLAKALRAVEWSGVHSHVYYEGMDDFLACPSCDGIKLTENHSVIECAKYLTVVSKYSHTTDCELAVALAAWDAGEAT